MTKEPEPERRKTLEACLTELADAFRVQEITAPMVRAYWAALGEFSCAQIRMAFDSAIKREEFWPPPARVRKYALASVASLYPELQEISKR